MSKSQLIPFASSNNLPAYLTQGFDAASDLICTGGTGYPSISIKGKVFTLKRGDEKTLITRPNQDGEEEPARSLEVVILKAFPPGRTFAKTYYEGGFVEGSDAKPICYSNDGVKPGVNAQAPQCKTCAACPHNVLGSKISDDGKKIKACGDSKRLVVAPAGQLNDPMLLRVPFTSTYSLTEFGQILAKRGAPYQTVVAKISFDYTVAHPKLTFKPHAFLDESAASEAAEMVNSEIVQRIAGIIEDEFTPDDADGEKFETAKPEPKKAEVKKPVVKKPVAEEEDDPKPKVKVQVEGDEEPAPKKAKVETKVQEVEDDLDAALDDLGFDD